MNSEEVFVINGRISLKSPSILIRSNVSTEVQQFSVSLIFRAERGIISQNLIFTLETAVNMSGRQRAALINGG